MPPAKSRADRKAALERVKAARSGLRETSALDEVDIDDGEIYDEYSEEDYRHLVQSRREREDFVVDDDGLGYYDDGEEHYDTDDEERGGDANSKKRSTSANATLTMQALKKARKNKQALAAAKSTTNDDGKGSQSSMWAFVNRGVGGPSATDETSGGDGAGGVSARINKRPGGVSKTADVDALLEQLDQDVAPFKKRSRIAGGGAPNAGYRGRGPVRGNFSGGSARAMYSSNRPLVARGGRGPTPGGRSRSGIPAHGRSVPADEDQYAGNNYGDDDDDDDNGAFFASNDDDDEYDSNQNVSNVSVVHEDGKSDADASATDVDLEEAESPDSSKKTPSPPSSSKSVRFADDVASPPLSKESGSDTKGTGEPTVSEQDSSPVAEEQQQQEEVAQPARRRVLARPKLGQRSKAAQQALEQKKRAEEAAGTSGVLSKTSDAPTDTAAPKLDVSIQPDMIAAEGSAANGPTMGSSAGKLELEHFLKTSKSEDSQEEEHYLDFFWIDLEERNGDIILYGKVEVIDKNAAGNGKSTNSNYVSACCVVSGNRRNLFVLPKPGVELIDVHGEIKELLQNGYVPTKAGASWAGKVVQRNYAFEDAAIPREETDYYKVVYDAKYPVPSQDICESGGQYFSKIMGAGASTIENFILKRKLMGPCWIRIKEPVAVKAPISWCKVECSIDCPKRIVRLDLVEDQGSTPRPPPPVVSLSLKFKTVVHPKTHKSEIVSVSAICHKNVLLETASDLSPKHMTQLSLIRPLADPETGIAKFPRELESVIASGMPQLKKEINERALLSRLMGQIGVWDPDVIIGHNALGYDLEVLLQRCLENKIKNWSRLGRRQRPEPPNKALNAWSNRKDMAISQAIAGRLLVDTYLSAKEVLSETTYTLTNLAATQLKTARQEIDPVDIPHWFENPKTIVQLALHTLFDAQLVQRLAFQLQILPLTKQLTCIAGNIWSHTLRSNRAERTEYLLLHEFHRLKFLPPEKKRYGRRTGTGNGDKPSNKAKYSGGLVLEPKKGLYDSFILLLDFNSLYPSIIQEYNLCFTTIDWSQFSGSNDVEQNNSGEEVLDVNAASCLPPLPDESIKQGVLPRVIKTLVERRRAVKNILKSEKNPDKKAELDIRQKALKLTANSMYGCLGFSNSRFFAQPIAAMVTAMGRETLQRTVDIAQNTVGLDVIYGDTDSIMINTRLNHENDLKKVKELGDRVKKEVNRLYRTLELEIDGIFRSMLLLKKKKYAAKTVLEMPNGEVKYGQEMKGLDLVRRDWCVQSKDTGRYVTDQILSGQDTEVVVENILTHLEELAKKMRAGELPLEKYVITKGLSKHPNEYPDAKSQPHVQVAKAMLANDRPVNTGDHIPYIITAALQVDGDAQAKAPSSTERARHPEEIARSAGVLKPDIEWYLTQQILPPVSRLCEPVEGLSQQIIAQRLGLDTSRYNHIVRSTADLNDEDWIDYTPATLMKDEERFKNVEKLKLFCFSCGVESEFPGVFTTAKDNVSGTYSLVTGLRCTNPTCGCKFWGQANQYECHARIANSMAIYVRGLTTRYYNGYSRCDEPSCGLVTRQLSVAGKTCLSLGCRGHMRPIEPEKEVYEHFKYLEKLFDVDHACDQLEGKKHFGRKADIAKLLPKYDRSTFEELHRLSKQYLASNAYNVISMSFWKNLVNIKQ